MKKRRRPAIPDEVRLGVFLRDELGCTYCDAVYDPREVDPSRRLTLDHLEPYSDGGEDHPSNLVTACGSCNQHRADRSLEHFCSLLALNPRTVKDKARRHFPIAQALDLLKRHHSLQRALRMAHSDQELRRRAEAWNSQAG